MADAIISVVLNRLAALMQEQIRNHVSLVRGVENEIQSLSDELNTVRNVLEDAEKKGCKDKTVKDWLMRLENTSYEMDDVLDEWNYSILKFQTQQSNDVAADVPDPKKKVWSFIPTPCIYFKKVVIRHDIALKIKEVKGRLDLILAEKDRYGFMISQPINPSSELWRVQSTSLIDLEEVRGRDLERENLVSKLLVKGGSGLDLGIRILSVVGAGGIGKTTLAKIAYNDSRVNNFFQLKIWICVSETFDEVGIANEIIEGARGSKPNTNQLEMVLQCLKETISGKRFLLVLDDVWNEDDAKWEPLKNCLKCGGAGSKILVTTRNEKVAIVMGTVKNGIHHLGHLSHEHCWLLLGRIALSEKNKKECEKFENIGKEIAKKCKGLPLAAKTLGSLLRFKNTLEEWESVLNSEIWELEEVEVDLFPHLLLTYNELSPTLKRCFSYCAVFPKDTKIDVESLITKWMALGYLGTNGNWKVRGREYFDKLAMRSLFQDFEKLYLDDRIRLFKMHDILHDFAQFLHKNVGSRIKKTTCRTCNPLLVSHVEEYRSLLHNNALIDPRICDHLTSLRLLDLRYCRLEGIPKEIEKLIHLRWLNLGYNKIPNQHLKSICKLYNLQFLWVDNCDLQEIPREIGNLIQLIHLDLNHNKFASDDLKSICKLYNLQFLRVDGCELQEIPHEIGNLIHLKDLNLTYNYLLKELPESLCNLRELESLNIDLCESLVRLPQGINRLVNLKHLYNKDTPCLVQYHQGLAQLTSLVTLKEFRSGRGSYRSKLGWLMNLNRLSGSLKLIVETGTNRWEQVGRADDAREADLRKKIHIQNLQIYFDASRTLGKELGWIVHVLDALEPNPNLQNLEIWHYKGWRLPGWIASPFNQFISIKLEDCKFLLSLPTLGKLPLLKTLYINHLSELKFVGREFLGITTTTTSSSSPPPLSTITGGFPKLRELFIWGCAMWKEWEDITAEEEEEDAVAVKLMPRLTVLTIGECNGLRELPQRLLRKMSSSLVSSSLVLLDIRGSKQLQHVYGDEDGQAWKSIYHHNPDLSLIR